MAGDLESRVAAVELLIGATHGDPAIDEIVAARLDLGVDDALVSIVADVIARGATWRVSKAADPVKTIQGDSHVEPPSPWWDAVAVATGVDEGAIDGILSRMDPDDQGSCVGAIFDIGESILSTAAAALARDPVGYRSRVLAAHAAARSEEDAMVASRYDPASREWIFRGGSSPERWAGSLSAREAAGLETANRPPGSRRI